MAESDRWVRGVTKVLGALFEELPEDDDRPVEAAARDAARLEVLSGELETVRAERRHADDRGTEAQAELAAATTDLLQSRERVDRLKADLGRTRDELETARGELVGARKEASELAQSLERARGRLEALSEGHTGLHTTMAQAVSAQQIADTRRDQIEKTLSTTREELRQVVRVHDVDRHQLGALQRDLAERTSEIANAREEVQQLTQALDRARGQIDAFSAGREGLHSTMVEAISARESAEAKAFEALQRLHEAERRADRADADRAASEARLVNITNRSAANEAAASADAKTQRAATARIASLEAELGRARDGLERRREELDRVTGELERGRDGLDTAREEVTRLGQALERANGRLEAYAGQGGLQSTISDALTARESAEASTLDAIRKMHEAERRAERAERDQEDIERRIGESDGRREEAEAGRLAAIADARAAGAARNELTRSVENAEARAASLTAERDAATVARDAAERRVADLERIVEAAKEAGGLASDPKEVVELRQMLKRERVVSMDLRRSLGTSEQETEEARDSEARVRRQAETLSEELEEARTEAAAASAEADVQNERADAAAARADELAKSVLTSQAKLAEAEELSTQAAADAARTAEKARLQAAELVAAAQARVTSATEQAHAAEEALMKADRSAKEAVAAADAAEQRTDEAEQRTDEAEQRTDEAEQRMDEAEQRVREAQAKTEGLRAKLASLDSRLASETAAADAARSELESTKAEQRAGDARAEELARRLAQSEVSPPSAGSIRKLQDALRQSERGRLEAEEEARQAARRAEQTKQVGVGSLAPDHQATLEEQRARALAKQVHLLQDRLRESLAAGQHHKREVSSAESRYREAESRVAALEVMLDGRSATAAAKVARQRPPGVVEDPWPSRTGTVPGRTRPQRIRPSLTGTGGALPAVRRPEVKSKERWKNEPTRSTPPPAEPSEAASEAAAEAARRFNINSSGVLSARVEGSEEPKKRGGFWRRKS
jgi:chromosome segregation ATPase